MMHFYPESFRSASENPWRVCVWGCVDGRAGPSPDGRNDALIRLVVRREVLAEGDLARRARDDSQQIETDRRAVKRELASKVGTRRAGTAG
jgi:hypothetical protein